MQPIQEIWHTLVPEIALSHHFLMHAILAVAAYHKLHLEPEDSPRRPYYRDQGVLHQNRGLQLQQLAMATPNPRNADALFAFSLLMVYLAFSGYVAFDDPRDAKKLHGVIQCIHMLRGTRTILPAVSNWVEQGRLSFLLQMDPGYIITKPAFEDPGIEKHLSKLLIFCSTSSHAYSSDEIEDTENFAAAAGSLRALFSKFGSESNADSSLIWRWGVRLPDLFVQRLAERHPVPLVLVSHWCVLLSLIRYDWWTHGWIERTIREIEELLPPEQHNWLEWTGDKIKEVRRELRHRDGTDAPQQAAGSGWEENMSGA